MFFGSFAKTVSVIAFWNYVCYNSFKTPVYYTPGIFKASSISISSTDQDVKQASSPKLRGVYFLAGKFMLTWTKAKVPFEEKKDRAVYIKLSI